MSQNTIQVHKSNEKETRDDKGHENALGGAGEQEEEESRKWHIRGLCPAPRLLRPGDFNNMSYESERDITWSELYFDLIFVVALARLGDGLRDKLDDNDCVAGVLDYLAYAFHVYRLWVILTLYSTRYGADDLWNKLMTPACTYLAAPHFTKPQFMSFSYEPNLT